MTSDQLKRLAQTMDAKDWPAARDRHLAELARKSTEQRLAELEEASLLQAIGFLRMESVLNRLVKLMVGR